MFKQTYYFPENVGYNIGKVGQDTFYKLEVHYDNPGNLVGNYNNKPCCCAFSVLNVSSYSFTITHFLKFM